MITIAFASLLACSDPTAAPVAPADSNYQSLFESGVTFPDFLAKAEKRKELWTKNYARAAVADALVTRARSSGGPWNLLVVAVDGCSDSANTIPYLARLVERLVGVQMRIVSKDAGQAILDSHRTPDGRSATPTVLVLDAAFNEVGCWVERPADLQKWITGQKGKMSDDEILARKMMWYDKDNGTKTLQDLVRVLELAARRKAPPCVPA